MDSNSDECWANMAINLSLESKDAINCELIRTIHKAPELTLFFPCYIHGSKPKEQSVCVPDS